MHEIKQNVYSTNLTYFLLMANENKTYMNPLSKIYQKMKENWNLAIDYVVVILIFSGVTNGW